LRVRTSSRGGNTEGDRVETTERVRRHCEGCGESIRRQYGQRGHSTDVLFKYGLSTDVRGVQADLKCDSFDCGNSFAFCIQTEHSESLPRKRFGKHKTRGNYYSFMQLFQQWLQVAAATLHQLLPGLAVSLETAVLPSSACVRLHAWRTRLRDRRCRTLIALLLPDVLCYKIFATRSLLLLIHVMRSLVV